MRKLPPFFVLLVLILCAPTTAQRAGTGEAPTSLAERLSGAWQRVDKPSTMIAFFAKRSMIVHGTQQAVFAVEYEQDAIRRKPLGKGPLLTEKVHLDGDLLTLEYPGGRKIAYRRLASIPDAVLTEPFAFGTRPVDEAECASIKKALADRGKRDQGIRVRISAALQKAMKEGALKTAESYDAFMKGETMRKLTEEMRAIDEANTLYLTKLTQNVGWIDAERFGAKAANHAFLIVQHSGNLRLMQSALPALTVLAKANPKKLGSAFALLYDRTRLALGKPQRYGSQLDTTPEGALRLAPLEDEKAVDARRREVGLEPLEDYLDRFRKRGRKVLR